MIGLLVFLLLVAVAGLLILVFQLFALRKRTTQLDTELQNQRTQYDRDQKQWGDRATSLEVENQRLSKWESVADADDKARELIQSAQATLDKAISDASSLASKAQQEATTLLGNANSEASTIASNAKQDAKKLKDEVRAVLDSSTIQAGKIVDAANKRAEEIAGSAYGAMKNASLYEQTVKAMKNIIEGYGDQYMIPGRSLIDDLAEEFGYTEAGEELKKARERSKYMIRNGTAATCEYVETNRRTTAINFVTDAFNGKVDSILSRVTHDNAGTLYNGPQNLDSEISYTWEIKGGGPSGTNAKEVSAFI